MDTTGCNERDEYSLFLTALKVLGGLLMDPLRAYKHGSHYVLKDI